MDEFRTDNKYVNISTKLVWVSYNSCGIKNLQQKNNFNKCDLSRANRCRLISLKSLLVNFLSGSNYRQVLRITSPPGIRPPNSFGNKILLV